MDIAQDLNMNDPGLDGPIANDADAIEARKRREEDNDPEEEEEREAEESYLSPSRWWFASTAFPLLAVCSNDSQSQAGEELTDDRELSVRWQAPSAYAHW